MCRDREFQMKTFVKKVFFPLIMFLASTKIAFAPIQGLAELTRTQGAVSANLKTILGEVKRLKNENNLILGQLVSSGVIQDDGQGNITGDLNSIGNIIDSFKRQAALAEQENVQLQGLLTRAQNQASQDARDARDAITQATALDQQNKQLKADLIAAQDRADQLRQELTDVQTDLANRIAEEAGQNDDLIEIADVLSPDKSLSTVLQPTP